ncbi:MAG: GNAT family N-acetyltransferase [Bacteroidetes bacterium MedPE-SWsnd-G1]|nr:MAG: GNAT family N-acetyltransferase [Bacteroidetes bacterium MedPE-SWsnd-G1]
MAFFIRQEVQQDFPFVFDLIKKAFENDPHSDNKEQHIVDRLRRSSSFIPELSLIAVSSNKIVGHILLTPIKIKNETTDFKSLALAPVSVSPDFQNQGLGSKLIVVAHEIALNLGFESVVVIGHENYYPKFGYKKAKDYNISVPFEVPGENCMAIELRKDSLKNVYGMVVYPSEFM